MKKLLKLLLTLVILYLVFFCVDYVRTTELKEPIFVIYDQYDDVYRGLGYTVEPTRNAQGEIQEMQMRIFGRTIIGNVIENEENVVVENEIENITNIIENKVENLVENEVLSNVVENNVLPPKISGKIQSVTIENGAITNEFLIDDFISNINNGTGRKLSINDNDKYVLIEIVEKPNPSNPSFTEKVFKITLNGDENTTKELSLNEYLIKRVTVKDKVNLVFNNFMMNNSKDINIVTYDLFKSDYKHVLGMSYLERPEIGLKRIYKENDKKKLRENTGYDVYILNGVVHVQVGDMLVPIEDEIKKNTTYFSKILEQAKIDAKYGICREEGYDDGGSVEYLYEYYTILKLNSLDGKNDLVIGPKGSIMHKVEEAYKDLER